MDIRSLHKEGHSIKAIARMTGRSRNTVRRVLRVPVKALHVRVLHRLAWFDVHQLDLPFRAPRQ